MIKGSVATKLSLSCLFNPISFPRLSISVYTIFRALFSCCKVTCRSCVILVVWAEIGLTISIASSNMNILMFIMICIYLKKKIRPLRGTVTHWLLLRSSLPCYSQLVFFSLKRRDAQLFTGKAPPESRGRQGGMKGRRWRGWQHGKE